MGSKFYAVRTGRKTGIFSTWDEAKPLVDGFKGNEHKAFRRLEDAEDYLRQGRIDTKYQNVKRGMRTGNPGKGARPEAPQKSE